MKPGNPRRLCETIHLTACALWLGTLVCAGAVAAIMFSNMRDLEPALAPFAGYEGDHAILAAGYLQNIVFKFVDVIQFAGATIGLATMIALVGFLGLRLNRVSTAVRITCLGAAVSLLSFQLFVLAPRMAINLDQYHEAARNADNERAEQSRLAFNADHPTASRVLGLTAGAVALSLIAGCWSASAGPEPAGDPR